MVTVGETAVIMAAHQCTCAAIRLCRKWRQKRVAGLSGRLGILRRAVAVQTAIASARCRVVVNSVVEKVPPGTLPDGKYEAVWHGYLITWKIDGREFIAEVGEGVRGWTDGWIVIAGDELRFEKQ